MTAEDGYSHATKICVTAWMWTAWAASTNAPTVAHASAAQSAAVTGSGCMSRWRWRVEKSFATNTPFNNLTQECLNEDGVQ